MGLIDFVKSAGQKLGLLDEEEQAQQKPQVKEPTPEEVKNLRERRMAMGLVRTVTGLGLAVEDLSVRVDDDVATVSGKVASQEIKEKVVLAVGNTNGIAKVDDQIEVTGPAAQFYTVVSGDTLSKIAKEHYGDAGKYPTIFEANKPMLEHPDKIYPGQVLRIPPLGE
jgi:nucleoid-associated protein YgaU